MIPTKQLLKTYTIMNFNCKDSFEQLSEQEKCYAYHLSKACWAGQPIILFQTSYESPGLFIIFQIFFTSFELSVSDIKPFLLKEKNISDIDYIGFIRYATQFYSNFSNFTRDKKKFIPSISIEGFESILKASKKFEDIKPIWELIKDIIYDNTGNSKFINLEEYNGKNCYYFGNIEEKQIKEIDNTLKLNNYSLLNTRIFRLYSGNSYKTVILIGSAEEKQVELNDQIILLYGEYKAFLKQINKHLENAKKYVINDCEKEILDDYINFFETGDIEKHKESQRQWIKDNLPPIEFNIGWIEPLIDPMGVRGYFEGWIGVSNKEKNQKYEQLVELFPKLINEFPWDTEIFEKSKINVKLDMIDILCFSRNGCPKGKCLPKYYDIQLDCGIKNIIFFNAISFNKNDELTFLSKSDIDLINSLGAQSLTLFTACKEILGHTSGKLLRIISDENGDKKFNFNPDCINPLTNEKINKYYNKNESFEERFTSLSNILEECRSIVITFFFSSNELIIDLFKESDCDSKDITYVIWLLYFRESILGLTSYNLENKKWGNYKNEAGWIITNYILKKQKENEEIIKIKIDEKEEDSIHVTISKNMIFFSSNEIILELMRKLQIWKCIGDLDSVKNFIEEYSVVDEKNLKIKNIIDKTKNDAQSELYLYHNLVQNEDGLIKYKVYQKNFEGIIESNIDRFGTEFNKDVYEQWVKYATNFIKIDKE